MAMAVRSASTSSSSALFESAVKSFELDEPSFTPESDLPVAEEPPVGARFYWRVRACLPTDLCSPYSMTRTMNVGRSGRDFNGDGFDDVAVGGYSFSASADGYYFNGATGGAVFYVLGTPGALPELNRANALYGTANRRLGLSVAGGLPR